jgi:hypothetical protein
MADGNSGGASPLIVAIVAVLSAAIAGAASFGVGYLTFASKDQELKVHLVEIAIGILRADPKEDVAPARAWAMDVIEQKSGVPFNAEDRAALLHKPLLSKEMELMMADTRRLTPNSCRAIRWCRHPAAGAESRDAEARADTHQAQHFRAAVCRVAAGFEPVLSRQDDANRPVRSRIPTSADRRGVLNAAVVVSR